MSFSTSIKRAAAGVAATGLLVALSAGGVAAQVTELTGWVSGNTNNKVSGSNRLMVVMVMGEKNAAFSATGVSYGGQPMAKQREHVLGSTYRTYAAIFTLGESGVNAATSGTIAVTWSSAPGGSNVYSVLLGSVNQTTPVKGVASSGVTSTSVTTGPLSAASDDMVIMFGGN